MPPAESPPWERPVPDSEHLPQCSPWAPAVAPFLDGTGRLPAERATLVSQPFPTPFPPSAGHPPLPYYWPMGHVPYYGIPVPPGDSPGLDNQGIAPRVGRGESRGGHAAFSPAARDPFPAATAEPGQSGEDPRLEDDGPSAVTSSGGRTTEGLRGASASATADPRSRVGPRTRRGNDSSALRDLLQDPSGLDAKGADRAPATAGFNALGTPRGDGAADNANGSASRGQRLRRGEGQFSRPSSARVSLEAQVQSSTATLHGLPALDLDTFDQHSSPVGQGSWTETSEVFVSKDLVPTLDLLVSRVLQCETDLNRLHSCLGCVADIGDVLLDSERGKGEPNEQVATWIDLAVLRWLSDRFPAAAESLRSELATVDSSAELAPPLELGALFEYWMVSRFMVSACLGGQTQTADDEADADQTPVTEKRRSNAIARAEHLLRRAKEASKTGTMPGRLGTPPPSSSADDGKKPAKIDTRSFQEIEPSRHRQSVPAPLQAGETVNFDLDGVLGPLQAVRSLDIVVNSSFGVVAAQCGKGAAFFDLSEESSGGEPFLELSTTKAISHVALHSSSPLAMTCDAAMDCKLWDLTTGKMLRRWRKWHSRPISKCSFFPVLQGLGDMADYAVSCSTDHSLKVWRAVMEDKARRDDDETALDSGLEDTDDAKRVHANEPFGGFDFAPAEDNAAEVARGHGKALLIAGLSYALKIYDALELNLLKSVRLPSLKESKTHISAIACHPSGPRTHVLVSAGCSVLLVECWSGGIVLNFNSRHVDPRSNIVGSFSPCAKYVYATEVGPRGADDGPSTKAGLHFWKAESATEVEVDLGAEAGEVASAAWIGSRSNPKERILVAAGTDGLLRVYR